MEEHVFPLVSRPGNWYNYLQIPRDAAHEADLGGGGRIGLRRLYLSVRRKSSLGESVTLHYYLTRSEFSGGLAPNDEDKKRLLEMSHEMIVADLGALKDGQAPERLKALRLTAIPNRGNQTTSRKS